MESFGAPFFIVMRRLLALLLLIPSPALAGGLSTSTATDQVNNNQAVAQPVNSQANQTRSESVGGNLNNYQINNSVGDLGEMTVGPRGVGCQSPSLFANAGVIPQDSVGFYTYDDRDRDVMYAPQAQVGFQMPFGPQVAACVAAMKDQATQIKVATAAGTVAKCIEMKVAGTKAEISMEVVAEDFPELKEKCSGLWGI